MVTKQSHNTEKSAQLWLLSALTGLFLLLQVLLLLNESYIQYFRVINDLISLPPVVIPGILFYLVALITLHTLFTLYIWGLSITLPHSFNSPMRLPLLLWTLGIIAILMANQVFFPLSVFAKLTALFVPTLLAKILMWTIGIFFVLLTTLAVFRFVITRFQKTSTRVLTLGTIILLTGLTTVGFVTPTPKITPTASQETPNIILIGIDSLRPDHTGFHNKEHATPAIDTFLSQASRFNNTYTPFARTFPAWLSVLTGQYPITHGARFNLANANDLHLDNNLARILQNQGYETIYATDESRFSNIESHFGFDEIITPSMGFNDFLLGNMSDYPLVNLMVNTRFGKRLFPYNHGNRGAYITYQTSSFHTMLKNSLKKQRTKPLFFAVHFTLPHAPYAWSESRDMVLPPPNNDELLYQYQQSVKGADHQFSELMQLLEESHLLDNSIVILFSDHGEALGKNDRVTTSALYRADKNQPSRLQNLFENYTNPQAIDFSLGHGTDLLSIKQHHVVMAFQTHGMVSNQKNDFGFVTSLLDIKPTILEMLRLEDTSTQAGISLASYILDKNDKSPNQSLFLESGFSPDSLQKIGPDVNELVAHNADYYTVNSDTGRVTFKEELGKFIIANKQYAILDNHWLFVLYPDSEHARIPVIVNLSTGEWSDSLSSEFAIRSPAHEMLEKLHNFFGEELAYD